MRALVLAAVVALAFAGCGGGDGSAPGSGYEVDLPEGWSDVTDEAEDAESPIRFDRVFARKRKDGFATNVNVIRERLPEGATLKQIEGYAPEQLRAFGATDIRPARRTEIGGGPATAREYRIDVGQGPLRGKQLQTVHGKRVYTITLTARAGAFDSHVAGFEAILDSWRWD